MGDIEITITSFAPLAILAREYFLQEIAYSLKLFKIVL